MNSLIENFILGNILGDELYISNGELLIVKNRLYLDYRYAHYTKLLKSINNTKIPIEKIPYEKGESVEMTKTAELESNLKINVNFGNKYFAYDYVKLAHMLTDIDSYTLVKPIGHNYPHLLKFWNANGHFLGCLAEVINPENKKEVTNNA